MVVRRGLATAAFAGLLTAPSIAGAQAFSVNPSVAFSGGYAANALFTQTDSGTTVKTAGAPFLTLGPALAMTLETPRTVNSLALALAGTLPIPINKTFKELPPSVTGNVTYTSHIELSELWNLDLGGALSAVPVNSFVNSVSAASSTLTATR